MGGKRGGGYVRPRGNPEFLRDNVNRAKQEFTFNAADLTFGLPGRRGSVRVIYAQDALAAATRLFTILKSNGIAGRPTNEGGLRVSFQDGSHIVFRKNSKSGGPALTINPGSSMNNVLSEHKIHFERKEAK